MIQADDQQMPLSNMDLPLGLRLRRAREAAGFSVAEAAEKMRLKSITVDALEREDLDSLGAPIYVRGYYVSYAKLVGVPTTLVDSRFATRTTPLPELRTTARVSHSRYLFDRYAKRAVYVVLTASIVVPVILLATRNQLPREGAMLTPLDSPVTAEVSEKTLSVPVPTRAADADAQADAAVDPQTPTPTRSAGETPVMASLGPFLGQSFEEPTPSAAAPASIPAAAGLSLHLRGDSWVEVLDRNGRRLEQGVLRAGETREYAPGTVGRVSLGNAEVVEVRMNGAVTDIAAFRRANVARFTVSSEGSLAPAGG